MRSVDCGAMSDRPMLERATFKGRRADCGMTSPEGRGLFRIENPERDAANVQPIAWSIYMGL
jgi:hypothetical protein